MSVYNKTCVLVSGTHTPSSAGSIVRIPMAPGGIIHGLSVRIETLGTEVTHVLRIQTDEASPVTVVDLAVGTTVAFTTISARTTDAVRNTNLDVTGYELISVVNDATAVYSYQVIGTVPYPEAA